MSSMTNIEIYDMVAMCDVTVRGKKKKKTERIKLLVRTDMLE